MVSSLELLLDSLATGTATNAVFFTPPPHGFKFLYGDPAKSRADNIFLRSEDQNCDYNGKNVNFAITNIIYENSSFIVLDIQLFIIFLKKNTFSKIVESVVFHLNVSKSTPLLVSTLTCQVDVLATVAV